MERKQTNEAKQKVRFIIESSADGVKSVLRSTGELYTKDHARYLRYEEFSEDSEKTTTIMKLAPEFIKVVRRGPVMSELTFILQQTTTGQLETPHGGWKLNVRTSSLSNQLSGNEGTISWAYDLFDEERHLGVFEFTVHIKEDPDL